MSWVVLCRVPVCAIAASPSLLGQKRSPLSARHSGAARRAEPGIHNHRRLLSGEMQRLACLAQLPVAMGSGLALTRAPERRGEGAWPVSDLVVGPSEGHSDHAFVGRELN